MVKKQTNFILFLIFLITFLGLLPLFVDLFFHRPPGTVYSFAHNYMLDYYQYLSWMKDGEDGKFLITSRYSPENFSPPGGGQARHPVYLFYPLLGFVTSRLGLSLPLGYTFARIFWSLARLLIVYLLITEILEKPSQRILAFFLATFLPPFYQLFPPKLAFPTVSSLDPLMRTFFIPHDLATISLLMLAAIYFNRWLKNPSLKILVLSCLFLLLATIFNPAITSLFLLLFAAAGLLASISQPKVFLRLVFGGLVLGIFCLPLIFYYQRLFATTLPFSWMYQQQKVVQILSPKNLFLAYSPALFLAIFGLAGFFRKKEFLAKFILSWAVVPFLFGPFLGKAIPLSQERLFELYLFVPLGILAGQGLGKIKKVAFVFGAAAFFSLPYFFASLKWQIGMFATPYINIYIRQPLLEAFAWLDKNTPPESVVVAPYFTANMLPAFAHNKVVFGHDFVTFQAAEKLKEVNFIYGEGTDPQKIKEILGRWGVKYILFTPESPPLEKTGLAKINLKLVFKNSENQIYEVIP